MSNYTSFLERMILDKLAYLWDYSLIQEEKMQEDYDKELDYHEFLTVLLETTISCAKLSKKEQEVYARDDAIEAPYTGSYANLFGIYVDSRKEQDPFEVLCVVELRRHIKKALSTITSTRRAPRKWDVLVLVLRFGLFGCEEHTQKQIAKLIGVSKGRAHQIEMRALRLLRDPIRSRLLKHFYEY